MSWCVCSAVSLRPPSILSSVLCLTGRPVLNTPQSRAWTSPSASPFFSPSSYWRLEFLRKVLNRILQGKSSRKCYSSAWPSARTQTFYQLVTHAVTKNPFLSVRGPDFWLICATYKRWNFRTWRKAPATVLDVSHNPILFSQLNEVGISLMLWKTHANAHRVSRTDEVYKAKRFGIQTAICLACYPTPCDLSSIKSFSENKPKDITEKSIAIFLKNARVISSISFVHTLFHVRETPK